MENEEIFELGCENCGKTVTDGVSIIVSMYQPYESVETGPRPPELVFICSECDEIIFFAV
jgi:RNase P subunit RPR2